MKIPLFKTYSDENDVKAVAEVIRRGTYWADGPETMEFEKKIADFTGTRYAAVFNSGTSALHAVLLAYDVKGMEVIVPSFTFISTANSAVLAGAKPVFAEVEDETFGLDYTDVKKRITKKTKAVIIVHYAGCPARDTEKIKQLCKEKRILFLEDAAESMGAKIKGRNVGTFGDSAMLSFCQNKIIATGEGGAIVTDDEAIYKKLKIIRSHGRIVAEGENYFSTTRDNDYVELGYNYRMNTMTAALGISQIEKIEKLMSLRKKVAKLLNKGLEKIKEIKPHFPPKEFEHVYQMYTITLPGKSVRDKLQEHLKQKGIMSKVYFTPVHLKTYYKKNHQYKNNDLPKTEQISEKVLTLPLYPEMKMEEINFIISTIEKFFSKGDDR